MAPYNQYDYINNNNIRHTAHHFVQFSAKSLLAHCDVVHRYDRQPTPQSVAAQHSLVFTTSMHTIVCVIPIIKPIITLQTPYNLFNKKKRK